MTESTERPLGVNLQALAFFNDNQRTQTRAHSNLRPTEAAGLLFAQTTCARATWPPHRQRFGIATLMSPWPLHEPSIRTLGSHALSPHQLETACKESVAKCAKQTVTADVPAPTLNCTTTNAATLSRFKKIDKS